MNKLDLLKAGASLLVSTGTTKIVAGIIKNNTDPQSVTDKVTIAAGSLALGGVAADLSRAYVGGKIDEVAVFYHKRIKKN